MTEMLTLQGGFLQRPIVPKEQRITVASRRQFISLVKNCGDWSQFLAGKPVYLGSLAYTSTFEVIAAARNAAMHQFIDALPPPGVEGEPAELEDQGVGPMALDIDDNGANNVADEEDDEKEEEDSRRRHSRMGLVPRSRMGLVPRGPRRKASLAARASKKA